MLLKIANTKTQGLIRYANANFMFYIVYVQKRRDTGKSSSKII